MFTPCFGVLFSHREIWSSPFQRSSVSLVCKLKPSPRDTQLTGRKWHSLLLSGSSETPRIWASGILDGLGVLPSPSPGTVQELVSSGVCCRIHWIPPARTRQNHPHQTWNFHLHQLSHHVYVHCSCHKDHIACSWDGGQPWLLQNCLHPMIFPNLQEKKKR